MTNAPVCWIITDGKVGMESQCLGLAEALGLVPLVKRTRLRWPWRHLGPTLIRSVPRWGLSPLGDDLGGPLPDILIGSGRQSVLPSLLVRRLSGGAAFRIQIQAPGIDPGNFDVVIVPSHDRLRGANVLVTRGALHRVDAGRLAAAREHFAARLDTLPHPRIAVLVGGGNDVFRLTPAVTARLAEDLAALARREAGSLLVTPSRRTGRESTAILRDRLAGIPGEVWDGSGENPYFGYLAHADAIIVTEDSVNMISEAAATGKPVHLARLEGGSAKFRRFHEGLIADGVIRPFAGQLETWSYRPLADMAEVTAAIRPRLAARGITLP